MQVDKSECEDFEVRFCCPKDEIVSTSTPLLTESVTPIPNLEKSCRKILMPKNRDELRKLNRLLRNNFVFY